MNPTIVAPRTARLILSSRTSVRTSRFVERQDRGSHVRVDRQVASEDEPQEEQEDDEDGQRDGGHVGQEFHEPESRRGPDQDVRRVADERRRSADIRRQDLG